MPLVKLNSYQKMQPNGHQYGLALIEVLLSLSLSSVMFLVLFTAQNHSQKILIYSQQLHYANRLLDQVANQVWAYPGHYQLLDSKSFPTDSDCLHGPYCAPVAMVQAWAAYWQSELQQLPNAELTVACFNRCLSGGIVVVKLTWSQALAVAAGQCPMGVACVYVDIAL